MKKDFWICYRGLGGLINSVPEKSDNLTNARFVFPYATTVYRHDVTNLDYMEEHLVLEFEYMGKTIRNKRRTIYVLELKYINNHLM